MDINCYKAGIEQCWNDEIYGASLFNAMAEKALHNREKDLANKLFKLKALELAVHDNMSVLAIKYELSSHNDEMTRKGIERADEVWSWGWQKIMTEFAQTINTDIKRMQDLLNVSPQEDKQILAFLVKHEEALQDFILGEIDNSDESIMLVEALLGSVAKFNSIL